MHSMAPKTKKPRQRKFKIRWTWPYLIKEVYDNGLVDATTLHNQKLGRVNVSKIKPYHEPETTKAYALQALICHILDGRNTITPQGRRVWYTINPQ